MSENKHIFLTLTINDGGQMCSSGVPTSLQVGIASGGDCGPSNSGYVCQVTCQTGWQSTGVLKCENGQWNSNFACIDSNTAVPLPTLSTVSSLVPGSWRSAIMCAKGYSNGSFRCAIPLTGASITRRSAVSDDSRRLADSQSRF